MIFPVAVRRNRFLAPLCVFIFGMWPLPSFLACLWHASYLGPPTMGVRRASLRSAGGWARQPPASAPAAPCPADLARCVGTGLASPGLLAGGRGALGLGAAGLTPPPDGPGLGAAGRGPPPGGPGLGAAVPGAPDAAGLADPGDPAVAGLGGPGLGVVRPDAGV